MSSSDEIDVIQRYAAAEKGIEAKIEFMVAAIIRQAEIEHGVEIAELRIIPTHVPRERWAQAICTIAR